MKNIDVNKTPLGMSRESIGYYIAGLFALHAGISSQQYLLIGTGILMLAYGIIVLTNSLTGLVDKIPDIVRMCFIILALSICCVQLMITGATYGTLFFALALIYLAIFVFVNVYKATSVFQNSSQLVTMIIVLTIYGCIQYFRGDRSPPGYRWALVFISILWLIFLGFLLKNILSTRKNRVKSKNAQNAE
jgi:hypothetical protein